MAIYKSSNSTPSLQEIDLNNSTEFSTQVNSSGEPAKAYKMFIKTIDGKTDVYESNIHVFAANGENDVKNKELIKIPDVSKELAPSLLQNGKDYLWGIRAYNDIPNSTSQPNTLVCEGSLVGSTKYVVWCAIEKYNTEALDQIVYDRYIEFKVDKYDSEGNPNIFLSDNATDKEKFIYEKLMDTTQLEYDPIYRERQKITWVDKELGRNENYVKIEMEDPFTYNFVNGTPFAIYATSDKHTVTSAFSDSNSNINVSDWIMLYSSPEDAKAASDMGDTPSKTSSSIVPVANAKKITGYSSDTGEIRVHDPWLITPVNGMAYRIFRRDDSTNKYTELFSSDLTQGVNGAHDYYLSSTISDNNEAYERVLLNKSSTSSGSVWYYYTDPECTQNQTRLPNDLTTIATLASTTATESTPNGYSTIKLKVNTVPAETNYYHKKLTYSIIHAIYSNNKLPYYYDSTCGIKAGEITFSSGTSLNLTFVNESYSKITKSGYTYYIKSSDAKAGTLEQDSTECVIENNVYSTLSITIESTTKKYYVASSDVSTTDTTYYIKNRIASVTIGRGVGIDFINTVCSSITKDGVEYNIESIIGGTTGENDTYTPSSIGDDGALIAINENLYWVPKNAITMRVGEEIIENQFEYQVIGGKGRYNSSYVNVSNVWNDSTKRLFIQPNVNIVPDFSGNNGLPPELVIKDSTDGTTQLRIDIVKQIGEVEGNDHADITFDKLDDSQWILEGSSLSLHSVGSLVPSTVPKTTYKIFTSFMDTSPYDVFYARTSPLIDIKNRNTYFKPGSSIDPFKTIKSNNITDLLAYRINSGVKYYSSIAKIGSNYYSDESLSTLVGTLPKNTECESWIYTPATPGTPGTPEKMVSRIAITSGTTTTYYYVSGPSPDNSSYISTQAEQEYPVLDIRSSDATISGSQTNQFISINLNNVEHKIPIKINATTNIDALGNVIVYKFTAEDNSSVSYSIKDSLYYIYAQASLRSGGRLTYYFKPPVYNYRDMGFKVDLSYTTPSEEFHPDVKYYNYTLYDKNNSVIAESGDIYRNDFEWSFVGLDKGNNPDGVSTLLNYYTIKFIFVDVYDCSFTNSVEFAVYYPVNYSITPLELSFDCDEQAMKVVMKQPLQALSTDTDEYVTVDSNDIFVSRVKSEYDQSYVEIDPGKILNYTDVYKDSEVEYPIELTDNFSVLSQFQINSDFVWDIHQKSGDVGRYGVVSRIGHLHPRTFSNKFANDPKIREVSISSTKFMNSIIESMDYDDSRYANGKYLMVCSEAGASYDTWRLDRIEQTYNNNDIYNTFGLSLSVGRNNGFHNRDKFTIVIANEVAGSITSVFRDTSINKPVISYSDVSPAVPGTKFVQEITKIYTASLTNGEYNFTYADGRWKLFRSDYSSGSTPVSLSSYGISLSDQTLFKAKDYIVVHVDNEGSVTKQDCFYNSSLSSTINSETFLSMVGTSKMDYIIETSSDYGQANAWSVKGYNNAYLYGGINSYGISMEFDENVNPSEDMYLVNSDYLDFSVSTSQVIFNKHFTNNNLVSININHATALEQLGTGDFTACYYYDTWRIYQLGDELITYDPEQEYGVSIEKEEGGAIVAGDSIAITLSTSEKFELRFVNPEVYYIKQDLQGNYSLGYNSYAGCFVLYDVTDPDNKTIVPNCFMSSATGARSDKFDITSLDSVMGDKYLLKYDVKLSLQNYGDTERYIIISSNEEYRAKVLGEGSGGSGPNQYKVYLLLDNITVIDQYHSEPVLTPGLYKYDSSTSTSFPYGRIYKDSSKLYVLFDSKSQLNGYIDPLQITNSSVYNASDEKFYYSDSGQIWVDLDQAPTIDMVGSYDNLWIAEYLVVDNSIEPDSSGNQRRITVHMKCKEGGMM